MIVDPFCVDAHHGGRVFKVRLVVTGANIALIIQSHQLGFRVLGHEFPSHLFQENAKIGILECVGKGFVFSQHVALIVFQNQLAAKIGNRSHLQYRRTSPGHDQRSIAVGHLQTLPKRLRDTKVEDEFFEGIQGLTFSLANLVTQPLGVVI